MLEALAAWTRLEALLAAAAEMDTLPAGHLARTVRLREAWLEGTDSGWQWMPVDQGNKNPLRLGIDKTCPSMTFECLSTHGLVWYDAFDPSQRLQRSNHFMSSYSELSTPKTPTK